MANTKYIHSGMAGAPVLSGTAGANAALLDAVLNTGFGLKSVTSLVVLDGIATATVSGGHAFGPLVTALVSGATPSGLNGEQGVTAAGANTISWPTTEANGTATGSITIKAAPLGWAIAHPGTNLRAYKPTAPEASGMLLRLDDTGTLTSRVRAYESMSDVSTGSGLTPLEVQLSGGGFWPKSEAASAAARAWAIWGDGQSFVMYVAPHGSYQSQGMLVGFGDLVPDKSGDAYACMLNYGSTASAIVSGTAAVTSCLGFGSGGPGVAADVAVMRDFTGIGGSQIVKKVSAYNIGASYSGMAAYSTGLTLPYPNGADNSLRLSPVEILMPTSGYRGRVAGVFHCPQNLGDAFATGTVVDGTGAFAGRKMMAVRAGPPSRPGGANAGTTFIDLTGPWR